MSRQWVLLDIADCEGNSSRVVVAVCLDLEEAVVRGGQLLEKDRRNEKPEALPLLDLRNVAISIELVKRFKELAQFEILNAHSVVLDDDAHRTILRDELDNDLSILGKLDRIRNQIDENLHKSLVVGTEPAEGIVKKVDVKANVFHLHLAAKKLIDFLHHLLDLELLDLDVQALWDVLLKVNNVIYKVGLEFQGRDGWLNETVHDSGRHCNVLTGNL